MTYHVNFHNPRPLTSFICIQWRICRWGKYIVTYQRERFITEKINENVELKWYTGVYVYVHYTLSEDKFIFKISTLFENKSKWNRCILSETPCINIVIMTFPVAVSFSSFTNPISELHAWVHVTTIPQHRPTLILFRWRNSSARRTGSNLLHKLQSNTHLLKFTGN